MRNKLLKKLFARKAICALFAISTFTPFASVIISNLGFTLEDIIKADAAAIKVDTDGSAADVYVTAREGEGFCDGLNAILYVKPTVSATQKVTSNVVIKLNKAAVTDLTVKYHLEDYTAIGGYDYELLRTYETVIPAGTDSKVVTLNILRQSDFGVQKQNSDFYISRGFLFVLDSVKNAGGNELKKYDGKYTGTGYRSIDGMLCRDEIVCLCGSKYTYKTIDQVDPSYKNKGILLFDDYNDYLTQTWGSGAGNKYDNTYDVGGEGFYFNNDHMSEYIIMDVKKNDNVWGRKFCNTNGPGSIRIAPYQYHSYYDGKQFGIYRDWLNRVIKTGLGHSYGSFNVTKLDGSKHIDNEYAEQFLIGDYQFVGTPKEECEFFGPKWLLSDAGKVPIKKDHYNVNVQLRLHAYEEEYNYGSNDFWAKGNQAIETWQKYFAEAALNPSTKIVDVLDVAGFAFNATEQFPKASDYERFDTTVNYGKKTQSETNSLAPETNKISWFRLPNNEDEETFGMSIFHQHSEGQFVMGGYLMRGDSYFTVLDDALPEIDDSGKRISINQARINKDQTLRITVPFSEPVQCFENTHFRVNCGGRQYLEFKPVPGQIPGCDAVVYEASIASLNDNVTSVVIDSKILYDDPNGLKIRDFAQSGGHELNSSRTAPTIENIRFDNININKKTPTVRKSSTTISTKPAQSGSVSIDISDMTKGKVYYEYIKKTDDPFQIINCEFTDFEYSDANRYSKSMEVAKDSNSILRVDLPLPKLQQRTGEFYCFVKVVSELGMEAYLPKNCYGVPITDGFASLNIDNTAPKISVTPGADFNAKKRVFNVVVDENAGIEKVVASIKKTTGEHSSDGPFNIDLPLEKIEGTLYGTSLELTLDYIMDKYYSLDNGVHMFDAEYEDFSLTFSATDNAGNYNNLFTWDGKESKDPIVLPYSSHDTLAMNVSISQAPMIDGIEGLNLYKTGTTFSFSSPSGSVGKLQASVTKLPLNNQTRVYHDILDDRLNGIFIGQGDNQDNLSEVTISKPGYYEIVIKNNDNLHSDSFKYYITDNLDEPTTNFNNSVANPTLLPKNSAWQLNDTSKLYYLDGAASFHSEFYGGTMEPLFSTKEQAKEYCLANEYQDLTLLQLGFDTADVLNSGGGAGGYIKANGEGLAMAGQYWVRYKSTTWDIDAQSSGSWVYYFYSENVPNVQIDSATVAKNTRLAAAMDRVATILSENGKQIYLIDDAHIDSKTGAPKLTEAQLLVSKGVEITSTKTGTPVAGVTKSIDTGLYASKIDVTIGKETKTYTLAGNLPLAMNEDTTIYYSKLDSDGTFIKLNCEDGTLLKDAVASEGKTMSGVYRILEISNIGANLFEVYIDSDNPGIRIERIVYDSFSDSSISTYNQLDGSTRIDFYSKEFEVLGTAGAAYGIPDEVDPYSYVAIFKNGKLVTMAYLNSITVPVHIADGVYDVVVGDRSGNRYSFRTYISSSDITTAFKSNADSSKLTISVTNREDAELLKFDVYCDGDLVDNSLVNSKQFTLAGNYYAIIQDQYGNKVTTDTFVFTKDAPEVNLFYIEDGYPFAYRENENPPHIIKTMGESSVYLNTCSPLRLTFNAQTTGIAIEGANPEYYTVSAGAVTFNTACNFTFKVYYLDNEDEYVIYNVIYDNQEPVIKGEYTSYEYDKHDLSVTGFDSVTFTPSSLDYSEVIDYISQSPVKYTSNVFYGSSISSTYLYFQISDNTGISNIIITKDGAEIPYTPLDQGFKGIEFYLEGEPGDYIITAFDSFNKSTSLMFRVDDALFVDAKVDGQKVDPVGPLTEEGHQVVYGNSNFDATFEQNATINVRYEDDLVGAHAFSLIVIDGVYYMGQYELVTEGNSGSSVIDNANLKQLAPGSHRPFEKVDLEIIVSNDNVVRIVYNVGAFDSNLEVRGARSDGTFNLFNAEFSKYATTPIFTDNGIVIEPISGYVYCSKEARVSDETGKITSIMVAYNPIAEIFDEDTFNEYKDDMVFINGYYKFVITNIYGNTCSYIAIISDDLVCNIEAHYLEKDPEIFSLESGDTFYANSSFIVSGYNISSMSEEQGRGMVSMEGDKTMIIFSEAGTYKVTVIDKNHNKAVLTLVIGSEKINFNEAWLIGYNENAILKDQGYTNQNLTVNLNEESLEANGIKQIYFILNGERTNVYGYNGNDEFIGYSEEGFKNVIGSKGDGIYYVYFANKYGDVTRKEIHFQVATTLEIERLTNLSIDNEAISVEDALANGVWSNINIKFNSTLQPGQYHFYVKSGDVDYIEQSITYAFEIPMSSASGEVHYMIYYVDAYGNIYEISVNLLKRSVAFNTSNVDYFEVEGSYFTRNDFFFNFDSSDVLVEYRFNNEDYVSYAPNEIIYRDGVYQFHMYDKSGNQTIFVVNKDSVVTFTTRVDNEPHDIYYGQAINATSVSITATDAEGLKVISVRKDGELITPDELAFTRSGHYELVLQDAIGNFRYFHFYLISTSLSKFDCYVPTDYDIASAYYIDENGIKVTCLDKIDKAHNYINLNEALEGTYEFQIKNKYDNSVNIFTVTIDKTTPKATLDGCNDGDVTTKTISLRDLSAGDIVTVYKDGEIVQRVEVSGATTMQDITEGGKYRIVIENKAGAKVEYNFEKLNIANGALSALVIIGLLAVSGGFFTVLLLRNRSKNDE